MKLKLRKGFSLIELAIAVWIMALIIWAIVYWLKKFGAFGYDVNGQITTFLSNYKQKINTFGDISYKKIFNEPFNFSGPFPREAGIMSECWIKQEDLKDTKDIYKYNFIVSLYWPDNFKGWKDIDNIIDTLEKLNNKWIVLFLYWDRDDWNDGLYNENSNFPSSSEYQIYVDILPRYHYVTLVVSKDNNNALFSYKDWKWMTYYVNLWVMLSDWTMIAPIDSQTIEKLRWIFGKNPTADKVESIMPVNDKLKAKLDTMIPNIKSWDWKTAAIDWTCQYAAKVNW